MYCLFGLWYEHQKEFVVLSARVQIIIYPLEGLHPEPFLAQNTRRPLELELDNFCLQHKNSLLYVGRERSEHKWKTIA